MEKEPKIEDLKPSVEKAEKNPELEEAASGRTGGVDMKTAESSGMVDKQRIEELKTEIQETMPVSEEVSTPERVLDTSIIENKIAEIEQNKNKFFRKIFKDDEETLRRFRVGLKKIKNTKNFAEDFMSSIDQGGEKLALEYVESIGNGELVRPENGILVVSGKRSGDSYFSQ